MKTSSSKRAAGRGRRRKPRAKNLDRTAPEQGPSPDLVTLASFLPEERLREIARTTGLVRRQRLVDPVAVFWVLVLGFGVSLQRELAALKREYEHRTSEAIGYSGWYYRFTPELATFMQECATLAIERLGAEAHGKLGERLKRFKDLFIQDGTVIRLHEKLAKKFPATRARKTAAGVKLSLLISAVANGPKKGAIAGERTSDVQMLRVGPWVKDSILLLDLGYYKYQLFARIAENGGHFVTRLKDNANPLLVASNTVHRGRAIAVGGKRWQDVLPLLRRGVFDGKIEVTFPRRKYNGRRSGDTMHVRLAAVWNEEARKYHAYLTKVPPDVLEAKEVADLYSCRWDVELVFKELKSRYALDQIPSTNEHVVKALIWTAILTLLVSRRLYNMIRSQAPQRNWARFTSLRWAKVFSQWAFEILSDLLLHLKLARDRTAVRWLHVTMMTGQAFDPHVNRSRLKDGWVA